jgi:hypothetical protein
MTEKEITNIIIEEPVDSPFRKDPMRFYISAADEILGDRFESYWAKVLGDRPKATWLDGGIIAIGDIIIRSLNDPKSYKFDHFAASVGKYNGLTAWKVDYWFRAKNAFGALILDHYYFYMRNGEVIGMEKPKD